VAICGASAAMALASLVGERQVSKAQLTLVLVGISALSSLALVFYPLAARAIGFTDLQAGAGGCFGSAPALSCIDSSQGR